MQIGFTFLVLPFWNQLTRVVPDQIQKSREMTVCVAVLELWWLAASLVFKFWKY